MSCEFAFFVYVLRCSDGSYYIGHSADVEERVAAHNAGQGAVWTGCRRPVVLLHQEPFATKAEAVSRERQLKRWSHAKKDALVEGNITRLKELSKSK